MLNVVIDTIKDVADKFKNFIIENGSNPVLWITLFFAGLLIFWSTYNALHKD